MSKSTVTILSTFLGIIASFAFQTGNYLLGAGALIAYGLLTLIVGPSLGKRVLGGCMIGFGLYVLALVLGILVYAAIALLGLG